MLNIIDAFHSKWKLEPNVKFLFVVTTVTTNYF